MNEKPEKLRKYPKTDIIEVIDTIPTDHPYCLASRHIVWAADHFGGILNNEAIRDAEKHGARCDICKGRLEYDEHKEALLLAVKFKGELIDTPGLHEYLLSIKDMTKQDGYEGWAFKQIKE